ncbi:MAG: YmfQ family protein [Muribaculaceae bacterium]|nr:YmfQ family protein [Muribaculaceae bacterium]
MIEALPAILRDNAELNSLFNSEELELENVKLLLIKGLNDQYIDTATITGISRWEKILDLKPDILNETIEQRRQRIKAKLLGRMPFTVRTLKQRLSSILQDIPYELRIDYNRYYLNIRIISEMPIDEYYYHQIEEALTVMLPANMTALVELRFKEHQEVKPYGHRYLRFYTHKEIRSLKPLYFNKNSDLKGYTNQDLKSYLHKEMTKEDWKFVGRVHNTNKALTDYRQKELAKYTHRQMIREVLRKND